MTVTKIFVLILLCCGFEESVAANEAAIGTNAGDASPCAADEWDLSDSPGANKCFVTTTCAADGMTIDVGAGLTNAKTIVFAKDDTKVSECDIPYSTDKFTKKYEKADILANTNTCLTDGTTGLTTGGTVVATVNVKYYGATYVSTADISFSVTCTYALQAEVGIQKQGLASVTVIAEKTQTATKDLDAVITTTLASYKVLADSAYTAGTQFADITDDTAKTVTSVDKICLVFEADAATKTAGAKDIEIKKLEFGKTTFESSAPTGDALLTIIDGSSVDTKIGCIESTATATNIIEARTVFATDCSAATTGAGVNCPLRRGVCFYPFAWADNANVFFNANIKIVTTGNADAFQNACAGGKRKRRSIVDEIDNKEEQIVGALYRITSALEAAQNLESKCDNTHVVITIVVLSAVLIMSIVLNAFIVFTKLRAGKTGAMA